MTGIDRDKCQACGGEVLGGDDQVHYLKTPLDSFHHVQHLRCYAKNQRELYASRLLQGALTGEERDSLRRAQRMEDALFAWVHMQSSENSTRLYSAALAYFGIKPVIPD